MQPARHPYAKTSSHAAQNPRGYEPGRAATREQINPFGGRCGQDGLVIWPGAADRHGLGLMLELGKI
jgi:hypothetical protein